MRKILLLVCILSCNIAITQNVGIGTTKPSEKLEVNGNIKADTVKSTTVKIIQNAGAGKVLTSDANGNGSWQMNSASSSGGNVGFGVWGDCATNGNISEYYPVVDEEYAAFDAFGRDVAISGNYAVIGVPGDQVGTNPRQGSVSVFHYDGSGWVFMQKITDASGAAEDQFGTSVAISDNYIVVGASLDDLGSNFDQGSASIYRFNGSNWELMQKITDGSGANLDRFGTSVSVYGNIVIVGAPNDNIGANEDQGSVSVYQLTGTFGWVLMQKIHAVESRFGTGDTGAPNDLFGTSVSISSDYIIVGVPGDRINFNMNQGSIYIYHYNGSSWVLTQKISDLTGRAGDTFGSSVSMFGDYVVVGIPFAEVSGTFDQGAVNVYRYNGSSWVFMQKISDVNGEEVDHFGHKVFISGDFIIIGSEQDDVNENDNQGSASIYRRFGNGWTRLQYITDPMGVASDFFGSSIAIDGVSRRFLVGARSYAQSSGKVVFGKVN